jgi:hypothetical protein
MNPETQKFDLSPFLPCDEGQEYYDAKASAEAAWNDCLRGDWMIWAAYVLEVDDRLLVKTKALCVKTAERLTTDRRVAAANAAALLYAAGAIAPDELRKYSAEARDAYVDADRDSAAEAAAYAASLASAPGPGYDHLHFADRAALAATEAAISLARSAALAAKTDYHATFNAAVGESLLRSADICRDVLTAAVFEKLKHLKHK